THLPRARTAKLRAINRAPEFIRSLYDRDLLAVDLAAKFGPADAALMELVLSNNQGELGPLEIGRHVLKAVALGKGGKGKKGGVEEHAEKTGKTQPYITQLRNGAEVAIAAKPTSQLVGLASKTQHLAALHAAPEALWAVLVESLLQRFGDDLRGWPTIATGR